MIDRIFNMFGIGSVTLVDDSGDLQLIQVTERASGRGFADRIMDKVRRITEFGFASVPPLDSEVLMARRGGERTQSIAIATSHRASRPRNLRPGDSCLYSVRGQRIWLTEDALVIDGAGLPVVVRNASKVRCECDVESTGDVIARADGQRVSLTALHDAYNTHHHTGVATGGAITGTTDQPI